MSSINFQRKYPLGEAYQSFKQRAMQAPYLITFNDSDRSVTFTTERLIPTAYTNRPRVMLLFSNPHPHSVHQGMFLSPNTKGRENLFWPVMEEAGWLPVKQENRTPEQLLDICVNAKYEGPFDLIFYCYYAFPTDFPEDIKKIFGKQYFNQFIEPQSMQEFRETIQKESVDAVVTFNKGIFNLVSKDSIKQPYIKPLMKKDGLIQSQLKDNHRSVPVFLTFPTGWRYDKDYRKYRKASLDAIRVAIEDGFDRPENTFSR